MSNRYSPDSRTHRTRPVAKTIPAQSVDQYAVTIGSVETSKLFYGKLKVTRLTDKRVIFPYDGAEKIGPYNSPADAIAAAQQVADKFVRSDLQNPE